MNIDPRSNLARMAHAAAGSLALVLIAGFWLATVAVEALGGAAAIASAKATILWLVPLLIVALAAAGLSGAGLMRSRPSPLARRKQRRMVLAAANGLLVLLPAAWLLAQWSAAGRFDSTFYALQALELAAGPVNLALLGLNLRDGLRMRRASRAAAEVTARQFLAKAK
jgi:hypothetical protein